jgi:hypothetical protein
MEPIHFTVEAISEYIIMLLLITLYSDVQQIYLYQSVVKFITWAPTLVVQRYFTYVLTLHRFACNVEKNPLMKANKLRYSPFSYQMFTLQATVAI